MTSIELFVAFHKDIIGSVRYEIILFNGKETAIESCQISLELEDWFCENNILYETTYICSISRTNNKETESYKIKRKIIIEFENPEDALIFKLRWL